MVLRDIVFDPDPVDVLRRLHVEPGTDDAASLAALISRARAVARPKAMYEIAYIGARTPDTIEIGNQLFRSRVLASNLAEVERVFAFVATCGTEMDSIETDTADLLFPFWLDTVKGLALETARTYLFDHLASDHALQKAASMSPGSGDADMWPIEQQRELFRLLGNVESAIGVHLTDSCLMLPNKSISGMRYPSEIDFRSCQLCHREDCPGRVAAFCHELHARIHAD